VSWQKGEEKSKVLTVYTLWILMEEASFLSPIKWTNLPVGTHIYNEV